jgi:F0F1-type ATP synthase membrane subunit b/b'
MNAKSAKTVVFIALLMLLVVWLFIVWVPIMQKDNQAIEDAEKVIKESRQTIEKVNSQMKRIEKDTPRMPRIPVRNEQVT